MSDAEPTSPVDVVDSLQHETASLTSAHEARLAEKFSTASEAALLGWTCDEFAAMLAFAATREPAEANRESYLSNLHLRDLALAQACARGYGPAWKQLIDRYREPLKQTAVAISRSSSIGATTPHTKFTLAPEFRNRSSPRRPAVEKGTRAMLPRPHLQPGEYRLEISSPGFITQVVTSRTTVAHLNMQL